MDNFLRAIIIFFLCNYFVHYFFARIEKKQQKKMTHAARNDLLGCMRMLLLVDNFPYGKSVVDTGKVK